MRRTLTSASVILVMIVLVSGCVSTPTPEKQWAAASITFTQAVNLMSELKEGGFLDEADKARILPFVLAGDKALDTMEALLVVGSGDLTDFKSALTVFMAAMTVLEQELAKGQATADAEAEEPIETPVEEPDTPGGD